MVHVYYIFKQKPTSQIKYCIMLEIWYESFILDQTIFNTILGLSVNLDIFTSFYNTILYKHPELPRVVCIQCNFYNQYRVH